MQSLDKKREGYYTITITSSANYIKMNINGKYQENVINYKNEAKEQEECRKHAGSKLLIGRFKLLRGGALYDLTFVSNIIR